MATIKIKTDSRQRQANRQPIVLFIRYGDNNRLTINTGFYVEPGEDFDDTLLFTGREKKCIIRNLKLTGILNEAQLLSMEIGDKFQVMDKNQVKALFMERCFGRKLKPKKAKKATFLDYMQKYCDLKSSQGTKRVYTDTIRKIKSFDPYCTFQTMNREWLTRFEAYCAQTMKINAYAIHLRNIRTVFNYARDEEITTLYPFRKFKIKHEETKKRAMPIEQLKELRDLQCEDYQEKYRDMFMLSFYLMGINMGDLLHLKKEDLVNGRIEYHRAKTNKLYSIKVEPEAETIIKKYKGKKYLLNPLDHYSDHLEFVRHMNRELKKIGSMERKGRGGKKLREPLNDQLSSYWARHTWATIAAELDIPIETISRCLGHSYGSSVTNIYIKFDDRKKDEANRKVLDYVKEICFN